MGTFLVFRHWVSSFSKASAFWGFFCAGFLAFFEAVFGSPDPDAGEGKIIKAEICFLWPGYFDFETNEEAILAWNDSGDVGNFDESIFKVNDGDEIH